MPILLDTNVYLHAIRSEAGAAFFENRFLPLVFQTYVSGVVVEKTLRRPLDRQALMLAEKYFESLERAGREIGR